MDAAVVELAEPHPVPLPQTTAAIVRLADEGIPVKAIARALSTPSDQIYHLLRAAISAGKIIEMPRDDWPPKSRRSAREAFIGTNLENEEDLKCACARFFKCSPLEAAMLAAMLRRDQVTKEQLHGVIEHSRANQTTKEATDQKMVDVMICKLRKKLRPFEIVIETMWGIGYLIPPKCREMAIRILNEEVT